MTLKRISAKCPMIMTSGRDDPWVVPLWGQCLKRKVPSAVYLELSPAGEVLLYNNPQVHVH